jgi:signal transduction histidine kinase
MTRLPERLVAWFIPPSAVHGRTEAELARQFVFTHLAGPVIAQPMCVYLYLVSPRVDAPLIVMILGICSFWFLPFLLQWTGSVRFASFLSFQMLAAVALYGSFHYGGFSSPFLPWLIVSLLLGLFYHSKNATTVLTLFTGNILAFLGFVAAYGVPERIPVEDLWILGWLSIAAATLYMTWMALYYARVIGLRTELELEIERQRSTAAELEKARALAEETGQARARFFAKMSHELRTPLNAIIGYSDILLEDCDGDGPEDAQRAADITRINAAGRHLLSLVADVLDPKRIENDIMDVAVSDFALGALCDEVVATAKPMVEKNGNQFAVSCLSRDYVLRTDQTKIRQILINLLSNAGKFTQNGTVRLELSIDLQPQEDMLLATVADTGIGIAPDALPRLFKDYEQADPTVFNRFGGTGIGLALSRKLSILLGGDIKVTSRAGHGSRFSVALPAKLAPAFDDPTVGWPERAAPSPQPAAPAMAGA